MERIQWIRYIVARMIEREEVGRGIVFECSTTIYGDENENRAISRINEHNEERGEQEIGVVNEETRCRAVIRVNRPLRLPIGVYECNGPLTTLIVHHPLNLPLSKIQAFIRKDRWWIIYEINGEKSNPFPTLSAKLNSFNSTESRSRKFYVRRNIVISFNLFIFY